MAGIENLRLPDCTIDGLTFNCDLGDDEIDDKWLGPLYTITGN